MKFWSSLIAIIILVLSCMPCSDAGQTVDARNRTAASATNDPTSKGQKEEHEDLCSPFCQCACCSLAYALPLLRAPEPAALPVFRDKTFTQLIQQCPTGVVLPVWQPPQLS